MTRKASPLDRLEWDARGVDLRLRAAFPDLGPEDRRRLADACVSLGGLGLEPQDVFQQVSASLKAPPARGVRVRYS